MPRLTPPRPPPNRQHRWDHLVVDVVGGRCLRIRQRTDSKPLPVGFSASAPRGRAGEAAQVLAVHADLDAAAGLLTEGLAQSEEAGRPCMCFRKPMPPRWAWAGGSAT